MSILNGITYYVRRQDHKDNTINAVEYMVCMIWAYLSMGLPVEFYPNMNRVGNLSAINANSPGTEIINDQTQIY